MKVARLAALTVVVLAVIAMVSLWGGRVEPETASVERSAVPDLRTGVDLPVTWYCAAGTAATAMTNMVYLSNPTTEVVSAHITGYTSTGALPPVDVQVAPGGPQPFDVATLGDATASVVVESPEPQLAVDHQLSAADYGDRDACRRSTSDAWYFPALSTTRDAGAILTLFNPFPGDAGVDIEIGLDTGTRTPTSVTGVVVPAGTTKTIDLGGQGIAERRDQFSAAVHSRSGRVIAEVAQSFDGSLGPKGLQLSFGVPAPQRSWAFAGGFTGTGAAEHVVVQNPGDQRASVLIQVTPYGASTSPPEPIDVTVEARRYAVVDLSAETRIPGVGYHSIQLESDQPVVVARTTILSGPPDAAQDPAVAVRPALSRGVAISTGSPVAARAWTVPAIDAGASPVPVVMVHNPGVGIAKVSLSSVTAGAVSDVADATGIEVAPGDSVAVELPTGGGVEATIQVRSSEPVVVERITTYGPDVDLAFDLAVAVHGGSEPLAVLGTR